MKISILLILFIFVLNSSGFSQVYPLLPKFYQPLDSSVIANKNEKETEKSTIMQRHESVSYSVSLGTSYNNLGNDISMMNTYIAPSVSYWANSKLNFTLTGIFMQNNMSVKDGFTGIESSYLFSSNTSNYGIAGIAFYQLSEKWSVWGDGVYFENQSVFDDLPSSMYNNDFKTVSVGVAYKVNDNFHFNVQYRYQEGLNPAYNFDSPFYSPRYNPFNSNFGIWDY
ncbi:MAG: outer membrane beta-barrel protein [Bacteroidales bacterium]|jgi:hypothetical protein|nr:outer membrane beta-barrel protein [Bacteroidales bacterium]